MKTFVKDVRFFIEGFIEFLHTEFDLPRGVIIKKLRELKVEDLDDFLEEIEYEVEDWRG